MLATRLGSQTIIEAGDLRGSVMAVLDRPFSYFVEGAEFSEQFKSRVWDGRKRLVHRLKGDRVTLPSGLHDEAMALLGKAGLQVEVRDERKRGPALPSGAFAGPPPYPHQEAAIAAVLEAFEAGSGGVLAMPVRSGKTLTAANIIRQVGMKATFIAPSDFLVAQALGVLRSALPGVSVTAIGGGQGEDDTGDVLVVSIATLAARMGGRWFEKFRANRGLVIVDEVHHSSSGGGPEWKDAVLKLDAWRRLGLTGTLRVQDPAVDLWSRAICGPVLYRVGLSDLIEKGFLTQPRVLFVRHGAAQMKFGKVAYPAMYSAGIVNCVERNLRLAQETVKAVKAGSRVIVDVSRVGHARELARLIRKMLPPGQVAVLTGSCSDTERAETVAGLRSGRVPVVVGTLLSEGIDLPEVDVIVNGESGRESCAAIQRLRNLTPCEGKSEALVIDVWDDHFPLAREWRESRWSLYKSERAFKVEIESA